MQNIPPSQRKMPKVKARIGSASERAGMSMARTSQRSGLGEARTRSLAMDMVTKSLAKMSRMTSRGVVTNEPVRIKPKLRKPAT